MPIGGAFAPQNKENMTLKKYAVIVGCLWLLISSRGVAGGQSNETITAEISQIAKVIEKASKPFGYELIRGYYPSDEWEADEKKNLIDSHAYYTLFGKDSDGSCLSETGRIGVTILQFKDAQVARRHIAQRKEYHEGNMGFEFTRSNEDGFLVADVNGFYAAVIRGSQVILLEDRTGKQRKVINSVADALARELVK